MKTTKTARKRRGGQPRVPAHLKAGISERLRDCKDKIIGPQTYEQFAEALGVPRTTVTRWFNYKKPSTPATAHVVALAEKAHVQPTWLLLGQGPELIGATAGTRELADSLHAYVLAFLAAELRANPAFVEIVPGLPDPAEMLQAVLATYRPLVARAVRQGRADVRDDAVQGRREIVGPGKALLPRALQILKDRERAKRRALPPVDLPGGHVEPKVGSSDFGIPPLDPAALVAAAKSGTKHETP